MRAPDIRDVPCLSCQTMRNGHECDEPRYCACPIRHNAQEASERTESQTEPASVAPSCEHYWAWVSPAGARGSARICRFCHQPDPAWLNHVVEVRLRDCPTGAACAHCEFAEIPDPRNMPAATEEADRG